MAKLGPIARTIFKAAKKRRISVNNLGKLGFRPVLQLGWKNKVKLTRGAVTSETNYLAMKIAQDKPFTNIMLRRAGIPVPCLISVASREDLKDALSKIKFPVVIKPTRSHRGKGVSSLIKTNKDAQKAYQKVRNLGHKVLVEEYVTGRDYRLLIINNRLVAAMERIPPFVIGDGKHSVRQLVKLENLKRKKGTKDEAERLHQIKIDDEAKRILRQQKVNPGSILRKGKRVFLRLNANISTGGVGIDVTEQVHPDNVRLARRVAKVMGLNISGVDILMPDISKSYREAGGKVIEINGGPDIAIHHYPIAGKVRYAGEAIVNMLFPKRGKNL